jgi:DNA polymerase III delta prime subunit
MKDLFRHHATAIVGNSGEAVSSLLAGLEALGISKMGNPDFVHEAFEALAIDDSRRIREIHESMPFSADTPRVFIIELHGATREAQNALLKTLEEPRPNNFFFIILPSADILLPTVRSRLRMIEMGSAQSADQPEQSAAKKFLKMPPAEKISFADELAADISDEKKAKHDAVLFLNGLERELHDGSLNAESLKKFEAIARAREYMSDRATSVKMLLEYIALSL